MLPRRDELLHRVRRSAARAYAVATAVPHCPNMLLPACRPGRPGRRSRPSRPPRATGRIPACCCGNTGALRRRERVIHQPLERIVMDRGRTPSAAGAHRAAARLPRLPRPLRLRHVPALVLLFLLLLQRGQVHLPAVADEEGGLRLHHTQHVHAAAEGGQLHGQEQGWQKR